jgi:hypothetical protein
LPRSWRLLHSPGRFSKVRQNRFQG